jgi:hypothetical protein
MLSVASFIVIVNRIILNVIMLSVVMLCVVMLSVVAPLQTANLTYALGLPAWCKKLVRFTLANFVTLVQCFQGRFHKYFMHVTYGPNSIDLKRLRLSGDSIN